jgi:hypothetical protein
MKCEICGTELRAEPAITEPGWIIFHECIIRGDTEQEVIDNYEKIRGSRDSIGVPLEPDDPEDAEIESVKDEK